MKHIVALSGGKDSTAMALRLRDLHPDRRFVYAITPTGDELPEMLEHWRALSEILGPLTPITSGESFESLIRHKRMLPNHRARWCTEYLKIAPYQAWLMTQAPCVSYVGLRADEERRQGMEFRSDLPNVKLSFPMRQWGWRIGDVLAYLDERGISIPERTDCGACFFQTLGEWWRLWKRSPARFAEYVALEDWVSKERGRACTLRSAGRDTWPAALRELRARFEAGHVPRDAAQMDMFKSTRCRVCSL